MTEVNFARSFLTALESRPTKIAYDHYEDPRSYPARGAYILPKMPTPMRKRTRTTLPGSERALNITLKSTRNPPLSISLKSQSPLMSVLDLKSEVSSQASIPVSALRILYKKKPVGDSKVVKELVEDEESEVEFSIMVIGAAAAVQKTDETMVDVDAQTAQPAQGVSGKALLETEEFWSDLKGFLVQRLRDEQQGEDLYGTFKKAYDSGK